MNITRLSEDRLAEFRRTHVGIVFQNFYLVPTMTAIENVALPIELAGEDDAFARAEAALDGGRHSATGCAIIRRSSPAESSNGWRLPVRSPPNPRCCSPTSRPATSMVRPEPRSSTCCSTCIKAQHDAAADHS